MNTTNIKKTKEENLREDNRTRNYDDIDEDRSWRPPLFKKDPRLNIIPKEDFEDRIEKVFHLLWDALSKSFGPYGAPTIIYNYPYSHVTKDGYTIMKNLSLDASETKVDQAIADMAGDICGRLNYIVGDGTTSAIIATNSIYRNYRKSRDDFKKLYLLPRDILRLYELIKEAIILNMKPQIQSIQSDDINEMAENIRKVVYISSNADPLITEYITDLYKELGTPAITCSLSPDGVTRKKLITGYKYNLSLNDKLYINNDNNTMSLKDSDVIIFGTKITAEVYKEILKPLALESKTRGRHLIVAAPVYDEKAIQQVISVDMNNEYKKNHDLVMVLTTYKAISAHTRRLISDFAMLMNTTIIDKALESSILENISKGYGISQIFNIDKRPIEGLRRVALYTGDDTTVQRGILYTDDADLQTVKGYSAINDIEDYQLIDNYINLGYVKECELGLKTSQFTNMVFDKERYKITLSDAQDVYDAAVKKYSKLGTFNIEVSQAQERLYSLRLKMGSIEVGGDSELSQKMLKDSVDDAIKAASSAYNNGVIKGCNLTLIRTIKKLRDDFKEDDINYKLYDILYKGFKDVYRTVIINAFDDEIFTGVSIDDIQNDVIQFFSNWRGEDIMSKLFDRKHLDEAIRLDAKKNKEGLYEIRLTDVLIDYSIITDKVFDVSRFEYSSDVINSAQTDEEILTATIDLISLLIAGNQMVVTGKHNF